MTAQISSLLEDVGSLEVENSSLPDLHDRVTEAYHGNMGDEFARSTRERIHWICAAAKGARVLDVGCSQGITAILLGREGSEVVGIDAAKRSVNEARAYLAQETLQTQKQVTFIHGDFLTQDFGAEAFDTVIMAEVLEHLTRPEDFLAAAAERLAENGRIIVTVPFGVNDWPDHKKTFYLIEPWQLIGGRFVVEEVRFFGKWIGFIAGMRAAQTKTEEDTPPADILAEAEAAFQKIERGLLDRTNTLARQITSTQLKLCAANEQTAVLQTTASQKDREAVRLSAELAATERLAERFEHEAERHAQHLEAERTTRFEIEKKHMLVEQRANETAARLQRAERRLNDAELRLRERTDEIAVLQSRYERLRAELDHKRAHLFQQKTQAETEAKRVKETLSFRLGHALIFGFKSWSAFGALPRELLALRKEAQRRARLQGKIPPISGTQAVATATMTSLAATATLKPSEPVKLRALSMLDEISELCWKSELTLFPLSRSNFVKQIPGSTSDFAFLESCWKGNAGAWQYALTSPELKHANAQALLKAIDLLQRHKMKIAFWNKEDPMHYHRFLPIAERADVIFTTDANKVADYRRDVPSARVEVLPFAAQPHLCNPSGRTRIPQETLCFAGSYYGVGHEDRKRQMDALMPSIIEFDGAIYDRMSKIGSDRYRYPEPYQTFVRPAVPFTEMTKLYKSFKVFLNVNTIVDSPTMMSRRVYELLACGTPVVSAPSRALEEQFSGIVQLAATEKQANAAVGSLLYDEPFYDRIAHLGYREVMRKHTYHDRLGVLLPALGLPFEHGAPLVSVVMCTMRPSMIERIAANLTRQTHPRIEVVLVLQGFSSEEQERLANALNGTKSNIERIEIIADNRARTLGERFNDGASLARGEYVAKMDDDDLYFDEYLADMLLPFRFGDYALVGKNEVFMYLEGADKLIRRFPGKRHQQTNFVTGATFVVRSDIVRRIPFHSASRGEDSQFLKDVRAAGHSIYSADPFNFIVWRASNGRHHTWKIEEEEFLRSSQSVVEAMGMDERRVKV